MIWGMRRFRWAEYAPYQDRLGDLQLANASRASQFMMISIEVKNGLAEVYVGVPAEELMSGFDGFERVSEAALPKVVDSLLLADMNEFNRRFTFRHNEAER